MLQPPQKQDYICIFDYLIIISKHSRMILKVFIISGILSFIIAFNLPLTYKSTARILPPQQDSSLFGMMMGSLGGGAASLAGDLLGGGTSADLYVGILNSEAIKDKIIDKYGLIKLYKQKYRIDTYKMMEDKIEISSGKKDGIISISVVDKEPKRAAAIANSYIEELSSLLVIMNSSSSQQNRIFLEERFAKTKADLLAAENKLKLFQTNNKIVDVSEQTKGAIKGIAEISAQLALEEVKLASLRRTLTESSQEVRNQLSVVNNIKSQLSRMEGTQKTNSIPTLGSVPGLGQEYVQILRELKIQETLSELIVKQLEVAKLNESKNIAPIQIIQKAAVPDKKFKPKRLSVILILTIFSTLMAVIASFTIEFSKQMSTEDRHRLIQILEYLPLFNKIFKRGTTC